MLVQPRVKGDLLIPFPNAQTTARRAHYLYLHGLVSRRVPRLYTDRQRDDLLLLISRLDGPQIVHAALAIAEHPHHLAARCPRELPARRKRPTERGEVHHRSALAHARAVSTWLAPRRRPHVKLWEMGHRVYILLVMAAWGRGVILDSLPT